MNGTRHVRARCQQRGIKESDLSLIAQYGTRTPKGMILTRKDLAREERKRKRLMARLSRLEGVFVATSGESMLTAFRATRRQRRSELRYW